MKYFLIGDTIYNRKYIIRISKTSKVFTDNGWGHGHAIQVTDIKGDQVSHPFETPEMRDQMFDLIYSKYSKPKEKTGKEEQSTKAMFRDSLIRDVLDVMGVRSTTGMFDTKIQKGYMFFEGPGIPSFQIITEGNDLMQKTFAYLMEHFNYHTNQTVEKLITMSYRWRSENYLTEAESIYEFLKDKKPT